MRSARRRLPRLGATLAVSALAAAALTGCQLLEVQEPERQPSAIEQCVAAHDWVLDVASMPPNVATRLAEVGAAGDVEVTGEQRLSWSIDGRVELDSDLTITVTNAGPPLVVLTQQIRGTATGAAVFSGDVAVPRDWSTEDLTVTETMTQDDAPLEPAPWSLRRTWIDDTVGLVMECGPDTLEVQARGTQLAWTFHPEGWAPPAPPEDEAAPEQTEG